MERAFDQDFTSLVVIETGSLISHHLLLLYYFLKIVRVLCHNMPSIIILPIFIDMLSIIMLPNGPMAKFKLSEVLTRKDIPVQSF
jgi:hypothetical protein